MNTNTISGQNEVRHVPLPAIVAAPANQQRVTGTSQTQRSKREPSTPHAVPETPGFLQMTSGGSPAAQSSGARR
jgi:hypothetical protein